MFQHADFPFPGVERGGRRSGKGAGGIGHAPLAYRLAFWPLRWLLRRVLRVTVTGQQHIPAGNYLLAANHHNWVDPFVLLAVFPLEPRLFVIGRRSEALGSRFRRAFFGAFGGLIPVEPGSLAGMREALDAALAVLRGGGIVVIFPEGAVSPEEGKLLPPRRGVDFLAERSGRPVLPVAITGTTELYWRRPITVAIGSPLVAAASGGAPDRERSLLAELEESLRQLMPPDTAPPDGPKRLRWLTRLF